MRCHKLYITKIQLVISPKETNVVSYMPIMRNWKILEVLWSLTLKEMPQEFSLSLIWNWIAPQERLGFKLWCFHVNKIQKKSKNLYVFSDTPWLILDCYTFWGFNDNVTENPKWRTGISSSERSQIYRNSLSNLKFVSYLRNFE